MLLWYDLATYYDLWHEKSLHSLRIWVFTRPDNMYTDSINKYKRTLLLGAPPATRSWAGGGTARSRT